MVCELEEVVPDLLSREFGGEWFATGFVSDLERPSERGSVHPPQGSSPENLAGAREFGLPPLFGLLKDGVCEIFAVSETAYPDGVAEVERSFDAAFTDVSESLILALSVGGAPRLALFLCAR